VIGDILRTELGFAGMVVSDDMEMGAITSRFDVGEAAVRFLEAGGDLILVCRQSDLQYQALAAVESAVRDGRLTEMQIEASLARIARAQARHASDPTNLPVDLQTARKTIGSASHSALLQKVRTFLET
jgi:beta-N-acetylhexosaminidase